jgi:ABC-2 type transport system permease protein
VVVATILSLRWRILRHQFRSDWWRLLFVAAGAIWSISLIPALLFASHVLSERTFDVKQDALVAVASLLAVAWVVVPLLATGVDDSLDPARFAPWGIPPRRLMPGIVVAAFTTVPALFFAIVAGVMAATWRGENNAGWVLLVASVGAALSLATWVASARLATLWATRLLATRFSKVVLAGFALAVVALVSATISVVRADGLDAFLGGELTTALEALARTPWAAGFAAPSAVALGQPWGAVWRLAIVVIWLVALLAAWRSAVEHSLVNPVSRGGGTLRTRDSILAAVQRQLPGWRAAPTTRAVLARSARAWRIDPRYVAQVVGAVAMPTILGGVAVAAFGASGPWLFAVPVVLSVTIGWGRHNDLAYDASAVWLDIVSGVRGAEVMRGRLLATAGWATPAVVAMSVVAAAITGRWDALPAVVLVALGVLGVGLGIASISSILLPYRVPAPGESPFGAEPGTIGASLGAQAASSLVTGVAVPIVVAPLVAALVWGGPWWPLAAVVGVVCGVAGVWGGTRVAGALYERRQGRLIGMLS